MSRLACFSDDSSSNSEFQSLVLWIVIRTVSDRVALSGQCQGVVTEDEMLQASKILSVYMSGSKNMSYDSASLTTPDIKWLGVRPSDLKKYKIPEQCRLEMKDTDMKTGRDLLERSLSRRIPHGTRS
ncbi:hypothetical protein PINS_up021841 [Pythium insidiosum]|nr:hypothetical protein PINS_up021841 [Pythium insidiosum]